MNCLTAYALFQFVLFVMFIQSYGLKFKVHVSNYVDDKRTIGIRWANDQKQVLLQHGDRNKFSFTLRVDKALTVNGKIKLNLKNDHKKDAAGEEEEFIAFTDTKFPAKMDLLADTTLGIYYVVKKNGLYLWDYKSHLQSIRHGPYTSSPRDEHLSLQQEWKTIKD